MSMLDRDGRSPLHSAAVANDVMAAGQEIASGTDPRLADHQGMTPLHLAAQEGSADVAELLLTSGADVDAVDAWGNTPLFRAVFNFRGDPRMILLLRRAGAKLDQTNRHGVSPRSLAQSIANYDVVTWVAEGGWAVSSERRNIHDEQSGQD